MNYRWVINQNRAGEYVAYFMHGNERIWMTEGYSSKAAAQFAIESMKINGPATPVEDLT